MQASRWLPVAAGAILAAAAPALWILRAPAATAYASGLAGLTILLLGWPERARRQPPSAAVASWTRLARDLHLRGPLVEPGGRMFFPAREGTPPPLDDERSLHDGSDGYAAGVAIDTPVAPLLAEWQAADATRLRDAAALEEDLNALGAWTGWFGGVRAIAEPSGLRVRWQTRLEGDGLEECVAWTVAAAAARAAAKPVRLAASSPGEAVLEWPA